MGKQISEIIEYLDPVSPNTDKKLYVPAAWELKDKTIGFLSNGWRSYDAMGVRGRDCVWGLRYLSLENGLHDAHSGF